MGTRADFYIGEGESAEWLGSVGWDGYEWHERRPNALMLGSTEEHFRECVRNIAQERDDFTSPDQGWPWPWDGSQTTDYAYCWTPEGVKVFVFGELLVDGDQFDGDKPKAIFPNMKDRANVQLGGERSGLIVMGIPKNSG